MVVMAVQMMKEVSDSGGDVRGVTASLVVMVVVVVMVVLVMVVIVMVAVVMMTATFVEVLAAVSNTNMKAPATNRREEGEKTPRDH